MKAKQRIQPAFNDEMSFTDIIQFLILNTRVITTFVILGALLGGLYGQFSKSIYNGSILLAPAKISRALIENLQETMSIFKAKYSYLSKETNLSCPLDAFKILTSAILIIAISQFQKRSISLKLACKILMKQLLTIA